MVKRSGETSAQFEAAKADYQAALAIWTRLETELAGLRSAGVWQNATPEERISAQFGWVRHALKAAFGDADPPALWRLPTLSAALNERMDKAHPEWMEAQQAWRAACQQETSRVAKTLQPRQREIVKRIGAAAEALSLAILDERELHRELERTDSNRRQSLLGARGPGDHPNE